MILSRRLFLALGGALAIGATAYHLNVGNRSHEATTLVMSPTEAHQAAQTGDILLVDIRRPDEWQKTGVPLHALTLDLRMQEFVSELQEARVSHNQPIAVICARGVRSAKLSRQLKKAGIGPIFDVSEGMLGSRLGPGWLGHGLPVRKVQ
ncbi:hypothetical protein NBRC116594_15250 [Shimia sp. NS0008-38b]|uniref:rhodanese-like domain-containing protein n=1 Tax=Shimia sp. NS0008-38b TaxID=3127653 RepID=UPI00310844B4